MDIHDKTVARFHSVFLPNRAFDQHLEGVRQAEAAAARALAEQANNKNPVALWLESILGKDDKSASIGKTSDRAGGGRVAAISAKSAPRGGGVAGSPVGGVSSTEISEDAGQSYFDSSITAYALGLSLCFAVNLISKSGQPGVHRSCKVSVLIHV